MKIKKTKINLILFYLVILIQSLTIEYENAGAISNLKYIICIIGILYSYHLMKDSKSKARVMKTEMYRILSVPLLFLLVSLIKIFSTNIFSHRIVNELFFMILPVIYAYGLLNTLSRKQIDDAILGTLVISFMCYIISLNLSPHDFWVALSSMDYRNSVSKLESSGFAGVSISLALYYLYYRKNKFAMILSILFVIFTFKRLAILTVLFLIFSPLFIDFNKPTRNKTYKIVSIFIFIISVMYYKLMLPENADIVIKYFGYGFDKFTMSRYWRFSLLVNDYQFINYGLGSTYDFLMSKYNFALEMDICKLIIEVGYFALFFFIYQYFYIVRKNRYCIIVMIFLFLNMITSHSLTSMFTWIIVYLTIGRIQFMNPDKVS